MSKEVEQLLDKLELKALIAEFWRLELERLLKRSSEAREVLK